MKTLITFLSILIMVSFLVAALLIVVAWIAGNIQYRREYRELYKRLVDEVNNLPVTKFNYFRIKKGMEHLKQYDCREDFDIYELSKFFQKKYKEVKTA